MTRAGTLRPRRPCLPRRRAATILVVGSMSAGCSDDPLECPAPMGCLWLDGQLTHTLADSIVRDKALDGGGGFRFDFALRSGDILDVDGVRRSREEYQLTPGGICGIGEIEKDIGNVRGSLDEAFDTGAPAPEPPFAVPVRAVYTEAASTEIAEFGYDYTHHTTALSGELRASLVKPSDFPEQQEWSRETNTNDELWWVELALVGDGGGHRIDAQALARYCTQKSLY